MKTFLICHTGALGDFVLTWPALSGLRAAHPSHRFVGFGRPEYMRLAVRLGLIDAWTDADSAAAVRFFSGERLPAGIAPPHVAVLWINDAGSVVRLLEHGADGPVMAVPPFPSVRKHLAHDYVERIRRCFPVSVPEPFTLKWPDPVPHTDRILIHPGSGGAKKHFTPGFYLRLADYLRTESGSPPAFLFGPVECERLERGAFAGYPVHSPADVSELAGMLASSRLLVGNDSGVSHLAGVLGVPVIVFYRATDPKIWGIMGKQVIMIRKRNEEEAFEAFGKAAGRLLRPSLTRT
ncbi:MAG TPA: hypothetical protein ENN17_12260 [bacterium]|nr:hypothetical protein [bacterium]